MLTARPSLLPPARARSRIGPSAAWLASALLHGAAFALLLPRAVRTLPADVPPLEIEFVRRPAETAGSPKPSTPAVAAAPSPALPDGGTEAASSPPSAAPSQPQAAAPPTEVNLGNSLRDLAPLEVTGRNVIPASPDARHPNRPPEYPLAAARAGAEGTVEMVVHVAANGLPYSVGIRQGSGNVYLDRSAQRAAMGWHLPPIERNGQAVPFDYVINISFVLGNH